VEPLTTAILAAIVAGATAGAADTVKRAIADAYTALKGLLIGKFGADGKVVEAVEKLEVGRLEGNPRQGTRESWGASAT
jgi:hypothetical protein